MRASFHCLLTLSHSRFFHSLTQFLDPPGFTIRGFIAPGDFTEDRKNKKEENRKFHEKTPFVCPI